MEPDQVDVLAATVLRDLEEVDDTAKTRLSRQLRSDIRETDRHDRIHFDLTLVHAVAGADRDVGPRPYADTARDITAPNPLAQAFGEDHEAF